MNQLKSKTWNEGIDTHELKPMDWHEWVDMNEMTWINWKRMNWNSWTDMNELKRMNWHEWLDMKKLKKGIEMNELKGTYGIQLNEMKGMNWNEGIEINDLTWTNWNEWIELNEWNEWIEMTELKWRTWHEWIEIHELPWRNWNEWLDMNELKGMNCQKGPELVSFFRFFLWNRSLASVSRAFGRPHRPKVVWDGQFFTTFLWNRALATVSCTFCRPLSRIEARNSGNRDPPAATADGHFTRRNTGFCARKRFQAWIHAFPIAHTSQHTWWWYAWHDDVVAVMIEMMMSLPWLMVRQLAIDNCPCLRSCLTKLPLINNPFLGTSIDGDRHL